MQGQQSVNKEQLVEAVSEKVTEILGPVIREMNEELKQTDVLQREYNQALIELTRQLDAFGEKLDNIEAVSQPVDTTPIQAVLDQRLAEFGVILAGLPKKHSFRILLYPDYNREQYHKLVWGRLMAWLVLLVFIAGLYRFGINWLEGAYVEPKYKNAWEQIYNDQDKKHQNRMDQLLDQQ